MPKVAKSLIGSTSNGIGAGRPVQSDYKAGLARGFTRARFWLAERELIWRYVLNARATREFRAHQPKLEAEPARMLESLDREGYAISHVSQIAGMSELLQELRAAALIAEKEMKLRTARRGGTASRAKGYTLSSNLLGSFPLFDPNGIFARFSTQPWLLDVINCYFGMFTQLRKYAVFRTRAVQEGVNARWHRDGPFDAPIMRLFVYFESVTRANGAFLYARSTHCKSELGSRCVIPDDVLEQRAIPCAGPAGTLVLADTRAYHRAGQFLSGERWIFNSVYTSPGMGQDFFTRVGRSTPRPGDATSWALSSPLTIRQNFFS